VRIRYAGCGRDKLEAIVDGYQEYADASLRQRTDRVAFSYKSTLLGVRRPNSETGHHPTTFPRSAIPADLCLNVKKRSIRQVFSQLCVRHIADITRLFHAFAAQLPFIFNFQRNFNC
jgi:hypothetical protein